MWILFNKSSTLFSLHCFFSHHLLQPQVLDQRSWFESSVASNWTGTEGTLVMWWQWQEEQCPEPWILESGVLPTSSDRIDVHRRSHQSRWKPSSTGVITLTFQKLIWTCLHNFTLMFFILKHLLCYLDGKTFENWELRTILALKKGWK